MLTEIRRSLDMLTFFFARSPDAPRTVNEEGLRLKAPDRSALSLTDYDSLLVEAVYFARHSLFDTLLCCRVRESDKQNDVDFVEDQGPSRRRVA